MSLLALGTVAFDSIETPFDKVDKIIGGSCNYIAWAAAHLTDKIYVSAVVGGDYPEDELKQLEARGVNFSSLEIKENEKSFFWAGKYHMNFNDRDTVQTDLNVLENFQPKLSDQAKKSKYVMLGNLTPAVQISVIEQMEDPKLIALDTMNYWIQDEQYRPELLKVLQQIDVLIINEEETRMLSNTHSLIKGAKYILNNLGPKFVVMKKGEHGALLFHKDLVFFAPALPLEDVFDPTGAGDSFAGGFMGYLARVDDLSFENMKRAIIYGSVMASFCVEKFGPRRLKEINEQDIQQRLQEFTQLTQVDLLLR